MINERPTSTRPAVPQPGRNAEPVLLVHPLGPKWIVKSRVLDGTYVFPTIRAALNFARSCGNESAPSLVKAELPRGLMYYEWVR
jgi:hypothetical protein